SLQLLDYRLRTTGELVGGHDRVTGQVPVRHARDRLRVVPLAVPDDYVLTCFAESVLRTERRTADLIELVEGGCNRFFSQVGKCHARTLRLSSDIARWMTQPGRSSAGQERRTPLSYTSSPNDSRAGVTASVG